MKPKRSFPQAACRLLLLLLTCVGSGWAQDADQEIPEFFRTFIQEAQKHVAELPEVPVGTTEGKHEVVSVRLDEKPIVVGEHRFGCVRFVAPKEAGRDMVWAFSVPAEWGEWYILPASGTKMDGFRNWIYADRLYEELPATVENTAHLQTLQAASLTPEATYILWFAEHSAIPGPVTLTCAINFLPAPGKKEKWDAAAIEKGLGLRAAPMKEQVAYLKSRGGKVLLDPKFFRPKYAEERIENLLYSLRSYQRFANGLFIETRMTIPACGTDPLLADIQAAYGDADFALSEEERRLFEEEVPEGEAAYYYDHITFLVQKKTDQWHVLRVTTQAGDASMVKPLQDGLTWSDVPLPEIQLRIFYRDRKEIARVAFWGEAKARLISGELPVDTFRRPGEDGAPSEELKHLGNGDWDSRIAYQDGQVARTAKLQGYAYHGALRDFYPDGKPRTEANYSKGQLDGVFKQWGPNGRSRERRYKAGELVREGADAPR